jgi:hypothetical protein
MPRLEQYKGKVIVMELKSRSLYTDQEKPLARFKLIDIEASGIWIESDRYVKNAIEYLKEYEEPNPVTPVFFVPFSQIVMIMALADYAPLSENELGI